MTRRCSIQFGVETKASIFFFLHSGTVPLDDSLARIWALQWQYFEPGFLADTNHRRARGAPHDFQVMLPRVAQRFLKVSPNLSLGLELS